MRLLPSTAYTKKQCTFSRLIRYLVEAVFCHHSSISLVPSINLLLLLLVSLFDLSLHGFGIFNRIHHASQHFRFLFSFLRFNDRMNQSFRVYCHWKDLSRVCNWCIWLCFCAEVSTTNFSIESIENDQVKRTKLQFQRNHLEFPLYLHWKQDFGPCIR